MTRRVILILGFVAVAGMPIAARADLLMGTLNTTGTANISFGSIEFLDNELLINSPASAQQGDFTILAGTTGTIQNIANPPDATGPLDQPDFITFAADPDISITLTFLLPGIDGAAGCTDTPPAAGQVCTPDVPDQSPFNLQNTSATSSTASFNILGLEVDSATGDTIPITGAFTTPFTSMNFQQLLAMVDGAPPPIGGTITTPFSAQLSTSLPEPGTSVELMMGVAAIGIGLYRKKFDKH
jgi:hypothetical protein